MSHKHPSGGHQQIPPPARVVTVSQAVLLATAAIATLWACSEPEKPSRMASVMVGATPAAALLVRRPERQVQLAIALVSLVVSLWMLEGIVALSMPSSSRARIAAGQGIAYDRRSALDVVLALRAQGVDAIGNVRPWPPKEVQGIIPLGGATNRLTVLCNESGVFVTYQSDEHGFNNPPGQWSQPMQMALLGDSFVHGSCVPEEHTIGAHVRRRYPGTVNLGYMGNGPLANLAALREYVESDRPPVVLWFYFEANEVTDLNTEAHARWPLSYLDPAFRQGLRDRTEEIDQCYRELASQERLESNRLPTSHAVPWQLFTLDSLEARFGLDAPVIDLVQHLKLSELRMKLSDLRDRRRREATQRGAGVAMNESLFSQVLMTARDSVESWGGKLIIVYLPSWHRYGRRPAPELNRSTSLDLFDRLGLEVIDLVPAFSSRSDPLALFPLRLDGHYTPEGYRLVADTILRALDEDL
jgi:hypothetical protein